MAFWLQKQSFIEWKLGLSMIVKLGEWTKMFAEHVGDFWWEIVSALSVVWREPVYLAYLVFLAPRIFRTVCFMCPLLISTLLLVLVAFSFGPQLERLRMEGEGQWRNLLELASSASPSNVYCSKEDMGMGEDSVIVLQKGLSRKIEMLLGKLVAELGNEVEFNVLYPLESIAETFMETTRLQFDGKGIEEQEQEWHFLDCSEEHEDTDSVALTVQGNPADSDMEVDMASLADSVGYQEPALKQTHLRNESATEVSTLEKEESTETDCNAGINKEERAGYLHKNSLYESCRGFPLVDLSDELHAMDKLWEEEEKEDPFSANRGNNSTKKENEQSKDWTRTLACRFYEEQQNRWKETLVGKFHEDHPGLGLSKYVTRLSPLNHSLQKSIKNSDFLRKAKLSSCSSVESCLSQEEEMDQLWEEYNDAQNENVQRKLRGVKKTDAKVRSERQSFDSDADEDGQGSPQVCCLKALRFTPAKMSLRRPSFLRFSKAIKSFGLVPHLQRSKLR